MDTLTQITLGAACGEAVLGKKIGNRAMAWGAFGGLLPDLDVIANLFTDEIHALAFHRGFMHSISFAVIAAVGLGWLVEWLYKSGHYSKKWFKQTVFSFLTFVVVVVAAAINYVTYSAATGLNFAALFLSTAGLAVAVYYSRKKFYLKDWEPINASRREWSMLFWWSLITHVALDVFTAYGTQLFQPFSNYAVAFSSISVIDPLYTVPFLIFLLTAGLLPKKSRRRRYANWLGIGISSAYLIFTLFHKWQVDQVFQQGLTEHHINATRFTTSPTMFNNYLWQGTAETEDHYYHASFSLLDQSPEITRFNVLSKDHELMKSYENTPTLRILKWFSKGYYNILQISENQWQFNDLRYGSAGEAFNTEEDFAFRFIIKEKNGELSSHQKRAYHHISWEGLKELFYRIKGKEKEVMETF